MGKIRGSWTNLLLSLHGWDPGYIHGSKFWSKGALTTGRRRYSMSQHQGPRRQRRQHYQEDAGEYKWMFGSMTPCSTLVSTNLMENDSDLAWRCWSLRMLCVLCLFIWATHLCVKHIHPPAEQAELWTGEITMCLFKEKKIIPLQTATHFKRLGPHSFARCCKEPNDTNAKWPTLDIGAYLLRHLLFNDLRMKVELFPKTTSISLLYILQYQ